VARRRASAASGKTHPAAPGCSRVADRNDHSDPRLLARGRASMLGSEHATSAAASVLSFCPRSDRYANVHQNAPFPLAQRMGRRHAGAQSGPATIDSSPTTSSVQQTFGRPPLDELGPAETGSFSCTLIEVKKASWSGSTRRLWPTLPLPRHAAAPGPCTDSFGSGPRAPSRGWAPRKSVADRMCTVLKQSHRPADPVRGGLG